MVRKNILVASDSFKGTLSSLDICRLFQEECTNRQDIVLKCLPIADGGEGSLQAISSVLNGRFIDTEVNDLYFDKIKTCFYLNDADAYIECASCVGLNLANSDNNPGLVTTYGLGEQIIKAIENGAKNIYVFLGGSASNDGGVGLAAALGVKFFNKLGESFVPVGLTLKDIDRIDVSSLNKLLNKITINVLSDVKSPFYGPEGAAYKFAKQKGASKEEIKLLDDGLKHLSLIIKRDLNIDISNAPGAGAAGGLGGSLIAFANAKVISGIDAILEILHFDEMIKTADIVVSGEGKLDKQTFDGKVVDGIAKRCLKNNKELRLIVGESDVSKEEAKRAYPCIKNIFETNENHLPLSLIKENSKSDYLKQIKKLLAEI